MQLCSRRDIVKIECANHSCKCLRSSLEKLVDAKPHYKGAHKLSKRTRERLVTAVRCAIRMRSQESDKTSAARKLEADIRNSVQHIFGCHSNCSIDFCKVGQASESHSQSTQLPSQTGNHLPEASPTDSGSSQLDDSDNIFGDQAEMWTSGTTLSEQEESRGENSDGHVDIAADMLIDISVLLDRMASKATRFLENVTTNLAENWMSIRCKFDGGKQFNCCNRGSWNTRCYGAAIRMNIGSEWSPTAWKILMNTQPGS